jgi:CheY-like chemotaxis protein
MEGTWSSSAPSILVVDDDLDIGEVLCDVLRDEGYAAMRAANGLEAMQFIRAGQRPSVILLDLMMPIMNGWQFREAQARDPQLADIPVIVMTATRQYDPELFAACEVMPKPLQLERLLATVERYCLAA